MRRIFNFYKSGRVGRLAMVIFILPLVASCGHMSKKQASEFLALGSNYEVELPVFSITRWNATYGADEIRYHDYEIDEKGRATKYIIDIGAESFEKRWIYDESGRFQDPEREYVFDEKNNIVNDGINDYLYDENGLIIESRYEGEIDDSFQYEFDDQGRVVFAEAKNSAKHTYEYTYNDLGLPIEYEINNYGIALDEDENVLSTTYIVKNEFSPMGFLLKESRKRTYDSKNRKYDDYDVIAEYDIVGSYVVNTADDSRFKAVEEFVAFDENDQLPKPDSVLSGITYISNDGNKYFYQLDESLSDPVSRFNTIIHAFDIHNNDFPRITMPLKSLCEESNYLFYSYAGVLKALDFNTELFADGRVEVTDKQGKTMASLTKTIDKDKYVLTIEFR